MKQQTFVTVCINTIRLKIYPADNIVIMIRWKTNRADLYIRKVAQKNNLTVNLHV